MGKVSVNHKTANIGVKIRKTAECDDADQRIVSVASSQRTTNVGNVDKRKVNDSIVGQGTSNNGDKI